MSASGFDLEFLNTCACAWITAGSTPEKEFAETELKPQTMYDALGS